MRSRFSAVRLASRTGGVHRTTIALAVGAFFFLLSSYYVVRPVRDAMAIEAGLANMQWLFSGTFVAMLVAAPLFGWVAGRVSGRWLAGGLSILFVLNLLLFYGLLARGPPGPWVAGAFFVWVSVFNLFSVSVFWSVMADRYSLDESKRTFGVIAGGGSLGAIAGPAATALLATRVPSSSLLLVAAALLALSTLALWPLLGSRPGAASDVKRPARAGRGPGAGGHPLSPGAWQGFVLIAKSPLLRALCAYTLLYTTLSTFLYFEQARIVQDAVSTIERRTQLFAQIDLATNMLTLGLQWFVTRRFLTRFGLGAALLAVPLLTLAGFGILSLMSGLEVVIGFQLLRRAADFSLGRPAREALFTLTGRDLRYKAKNVIDTVVYRAGDAGSSWLVVSLPALGGTVALLASALALSVLWIASAAWLGSCARRLSPSTTGPDPNPSLTRTGT